MASWPVACRRRLGSRSRWCAGPAGSGQRQRCPGCAASVLRRAARPGRAHRVRAGRQVNVALIVLFNYYYTFLQLDPKDMADQLKRSGASIPAVRPGRATADYITNTLNRMSILGSAFLGALAAAPPLVEAVTKLQVRRALQACL